MRAASAAPTTPSATAASTSPCTSRIASARPAVSRTKARSCCAGRCSRRRSRRVAPPHRITSTTSGWRIDHNRACLSLARKLCRRAYHILRELGDEALAPIETLDREEVIAAAA
jgi:hypothetical protein